MIEVTAHLLWGGFLRVAPLMFVLWLIRLRTGNAAMAGVGCAASLAVLSIFYAAEADGDPLRKSLIAAMASISALRLAASLLATPVIARPESSRMRLGQEERRRLPLRLLLFFELQALLCAVLSLPLAIASQNRARFLHPLEYFGAALWLAAVTGLSLAHHRFHRFTMHPGNRRRVRHTGFRRYCPTPDDFFEWLIWVGYAVFALGSPGGVAGLLAPAWILFVRLRDRESLAAGTHTIGGRGDACRQDPRSASRLFSWPPSA